MNLIQENTEEVKWYTNLLDVADWLEIDIEDFSWHLSDVEFYPIWEGMTDPCWVNGKDLKNHLIEHTPQFIWCVLSAFPKDFKPFLNECPHADMNPDLWQGIPKKQLDNSLFEIVCWDSSCTLFIELPENLSKNLLRNAPGIKDLNKENQRRNMKTAANKKAKFWSWLTRNKV